MKEWLTLGEVAQLLGVHPSTVRNWADAGKIPVHRTQGGHRRFRYQEVLLWMKAQQGDGTDDESVEHLLQEALKRIRWRVAEGQMAGQSWYQRLDVEARQVYRRSGRLLLQGLALYLSGKEDEGLAEAQALGYEYAMRGRQYGLSLEETVQAFFFFRSEVLGALLEGLEALTVGTASLWSTLLRRVIHFTDQVMLTLVSTYEGLRQREVQPMPVTEQVGGNGKAEH